MTTTPGTTRIDEIRARADAATPGHWGVHYDGHGTYTIEAQPRLIPGVGSVREGVVATLHGEHGDAQPYHDSGFMARAREDVPFLLDRVAELEAQVKRVRDWATSHEYRWLHELLDGYGTHGGHL
jgi:hypothetical protein